MPALALLPSTIAGLWAGHRLWTLEHLIPHAVTGVAVGAPARACAGAPLAGLLGSIARLVLLTAALSAALLPRGALGAGRGPARGLRAAGAGHAAREPAGERWAARSGPSPACSRALAVVCVAGAPLAAGAAVAVLVLLPPVLVLLARPARTLATALWIT